MPILSGSRYSGIPYTSIKVDNKSKNFLHLRIGQEYPSTMNAVVKDNEPLDVVANKYIRQPTDWWKIAETNRLEWPLDIPTGTRLRV